MSKTLKRDLIAVIWTLLVTYAIGKWAFHLAYSSFLFPTNIDHYILLIIISGISFIYI